MDDLVAFLSARLDEDEAAANEVHRPGTCGCVDRDGDFSPDPVWCGCGYPARVLREVAAKREILAMHQPVPFWGNNPPPFRDRTPENAVSSYCECQCPDGVIEGVYPCDTARLLGSVYEWKPS